MADERTFELRRDGLSAPTCPRTVRARAHALWGERQALRAATRLRRILPDAALPALRGAQASPLQRLEAPGVRVDLQVRTTGGARTLDLVVEAAPAGAQLRVQFPPAERARRVRTDVHGVGALAVPARARECILIVRDPRGRTWRSERLRLA